MRDEFGAAPDVEAAPRRAPRRPAPTKARDVEPAPRLLPLDDEQAAHRRRHHAVVAAGRAVVSAGLGNPVERRLQRRRRQRLRPIAAQQLWASIEHGPVGRDAHGVWLAGVRPRHEEAMRAGLDLRHLVGPHDRQGERARRCPERIGGIEP
jgi:hypothetical protein